MKTETEIRNVSLLKHAYGEWNKTKGGSIDTWLALTAPAATLRSAGADHPGGEFGVAREGVAQMREFLESLIETWSMEHWTVEDIVAEDDRVVVLGTCAWTHRKTQKVLSTPIVAYWRFKDGKAVEYFESFDTLRMSQAAT
jgi:ketosteroid isomerase-like protein